MHIVRVKVLKNELNVQESSRTHSKGVIYSNRKERREREKVEKICGDESDMKERSVPAVRRARVIVGGN